MGAEIPAAKRAGYEQTIRAEGFPKYKITERNDLGQWISAGQRAEYHPILFVEPLRENQSLMGFDLGSSRASRAAIDEAKTAGKPTAWMTAEKGRIDDPLLYVLAPAKNGSADSPVGFADQTSVNGLAFGIFHIRAIMQAAFELFQDVGIEVLVVAPPEAAGELPTTMSLSPHRLNKAAASRTPSERAAALHFTHVITVADRRWKIECFSLEDSLAQHRTWAPTIVLLGGLLLTGVLVGYLLLLTGRASHIEQLVAERTRELQESELRFRRLVDNASDAFFLRNEDGNIVDVNRRACDSLGYLREELLSMNVADVDLRFGPEGIKQKYAKLADGDFPVTFEGIQRRKDGTTFPVEVRSSPLKVGGRRLLLSLVRDVTDRKRAEEELHKEQRLLRKVLDLHEQDRKLIAYEIHDGLAQQLAGALYQFQSVAPLRQRDHEAADKTIDEAIHLLREALAETRRLIGGLRPPILEESGVVAAVEALIAEWRRPDGPKIEFVRPERFDRLAAPLEGAVFRIVQEGLTNACRYSRSEKVCIELRQTEGRVHVEVRDGGIGFEPALVDAGHVGLRGIRERASMLGGAAVIESAPGRGTRIHVELPLLPPIEAGV